MSALRSDLAARLPLALALSSFALAGCQQPPEVRYETEHFEIATDFDAPVCAGTLRYLEDHLAFAESELHHKLPAGAKIRLYWLEHSVGDWCHEGAAGCYYPGTRVIFSEGQSMTHEVIHALLNAEAQTSLFIEEGLAEVYSGVGARYFRAPGERPPVDELIWLTPKEYRASELDYALAAHFLAWLEREYGRVATQRIVEVVVAGGGPKQLDAALERTISADTEDIEEIYATATQTTYRGLREDAVPELELDHGVDLSLRCDDDQTLGPLPGGAGGMYEVRRLRVPGSYPLMLDIHLYASADVRLDLIDVDRERGAGRKLDFFLPRPSEELDHPRLIGDDPGGDVETSSQRELVVTPGLYLLFVSSPGYEAEDVLVEASLDPIRVPAPAPE